MTARAVGLLTLVLLALAACSRTVEVPITVGGEVAPAAATSTATSDESTGGAEDVTRPEGWTEATHSNDVEPDYSVVFPDAAVNTLTITIDPEQWAAMQANMVEIMGEPGDGQGAFGAGRPGGPPAGDFVPPDGMEPPQRQRARPDGAPGGMGGGMDMVGETPLWVEATLSFDDTIWTHVGIRYKGNSSLTSAWSSGSQKLPFKLDFDEFEDTYPAIDNQRFYGFKQLSFANGFSDATYLRETLTYDRMRAAGLVASETAFYEIILDYGEGPVNLGVYTAVEVVDDTVIESAFGDDRGNIYEGDGAGVSLAEGIFDLIADSFEKENNEDAADWSDIEALYTALHAETRTTDPARWRTDLEAVFDVDTFLNWLAVSAVVQNWDTYGAMAHNFYLYNNPETGQLVWLPWDHNMTFSSGGDMDRLNRAGEAGAVAPADAIRPGGRGAFAGMNQGTVSFDKAEVTDQWPLIRFLLDDPVYKERYLTYLARAGDSFDAESLAVRIEAMAASIRSVIRATGDEQSFDAAVAQLIETVRARDTAVADFLAAD